MGDIRRNRPTLSESHSVSAHHVTSATGRSDFIRDFRQNFKASGGNCVTAKVKTRFSPEKPHYDFT
jgi:hypothetical protein